MNIGFCKWERKKGANVGYYQTSCGKEYLGTIGHGNFVYCPFCKGYVIVKNKNGKAYTEGELK